MILHPDIQKTIKGFEYTCEDCGDYIYTPTAPIEPVCAICRHLRRNPEIPQEIADYLRGKNVKGRY